MYPIEMNPCQHSYSPSPPETIVDVGNESTYLGSDSFLLVFGAITMGLSKNSFFPETHWCISVSFMIPIKMTFLGDLHGFTFGFMMTHGCFALDLEVSKSNYILHYSTSYYII